MDKQTVCMHTIQCNPTQYFSKEQTAESHNNLDESQKHFAEWKQLASKMKEGTSLFPLTFP